MQALEQRLAASMQRIDELTTRLLQLERRAGTAPGVQPVADGSPVQAATAQVATTVSPHPAPVDARVVALQESVAQLAESIGRRGAQPGLALHGFADVGAAWSTRDAPTRLRGFNAGTLDLYLTPQFGNRVKALVELVVEYAPEGHAVVDLERLQLGYTASDTLTLWLGRFHTPFGQWNTAYHHGANLQTSISRPRFIEFEDRGGILPVHAVGAWASGKRALGAGTLHYDAYLTNGSSIAERTLDFGAFTDSTANKMVGANLGFEPGGALTGLTVGVHGYGSTVQVHDGAGAVLSSTRVRMGGAYLGYDERGWEVLGEYYRFRNVDLGSGAGHVSNLGFLQVGRSWNRWTPFARYEAATLDQGDSYFRSQASGRSYRRASLGLRYAIDARSSVKVELGDTRELAGSLVDQAGNREPYAARRYQRAALQYAVAF